MEQIGSGIVLMDASGRAPDPCSPTAIYYLTGYAGRNAYLLLAPKGIIVEQLETLGGPELNRDGACTKSCSSTNAPSASFHGRRQSDLRRAARDRPG
ncbi:MAG: hypothetical protein U0521_23970 [Anaerolineae bacterium]